MRKIAIDVKESLTIEEAEELIVRLRKAIREAQDELPLKYIRRQHVLGICKDIGMDQKNLPGRVWTRLCYGIREGLVPGLGLTCKWCGDHAPESKMGACYGCAFPNFKECYVDVEQLRAIGDKLLEAGIPYVGYEIRRGFRALLTSIEE